VLHPTHFTATTVSVSSFVYGVQNSEELYDLNADPTELASIHASASPTLIANLKAWLDALKTCAGAGCRTAENGG
jgi:hypothetical protein